MKEDKVNAASTANMTPEEIRRDALLDDVTGGDYKYGFVTDIETDVIERGLNEDVIRHISQRKGEPDWLLDFRLKAYEYWKTLEMPTWSHFKIPAIDFQEIFTVQSS